jgi:probable DNA metabolism protein
MTELRTAQWDGSLESLFAVLEETCRRGTPPRRVECAGPPGGASFFPPLPGGAGPSLQPELFAAPETAPAEQAAGRKESRSGPAFPGLEAAPRVFPDIGNSGCPPGGLSAALLYELSANAFDAFVHAWMSELPVAAEIICFAWTVISTAWREALAETSREGPPGPAAGADISAGVLQNPIWAARPEARRGAEKAAADRGDPETRVALEAAYKTGREIDRLRGLLRFKPCFPGPGSSGGPVYTARCSPDHYVLPGLADHFTRRFGECAWAVIDEKRNLVLAGKPGGEARIFPFSPDRFPVSGGIGPARGIPVDGGDSPDYFEDLWRNYHRSINNPSRNNPALQRQFMPRRYWKYLPEVQ